MTLPAAPATAGAAMRPNPVHQRTSRPECAPGRAPRLRQSEACGCTGAESGAARPCSIDHSDGRDLRDTPQKKPAAAGPPPGGSKLTSRPAPLRGAPAAAGAMPPATCRGLPGYLPPPPEVASRPADVRTLEVTRWSGHRQNCVDGYVFDRRKVPRQGRRVRAPYVQGRGYSGFTRLYMYTEPRRLRTSWWPGRGGEAGCTVTR